MRPVRLRRYLGDPVLIFVVLLLVGFAISAGYGIARYQWQIVAARGDEFVRIWDFDGLEHVLIARAILSGKGYVVDDGAVALDGKHVRFPGQPAIFKAPLYQFFLAGVFAVSGFSFLLFFPLQALAAGGLSGLVGLVADEAFERPAVTWLAGLGAAIHPVLVNTVSQPYNESLFFLFFMASVWTFLRWLDTGRLGWSVACGCLIGLGMLTRESTLLPSVVMLVFGAVVMRRRPGVAHSIAVMVVTAGLMVAPWTVRNYVRYGQFVPVASISGTALAIGNNECVADESLLRPFWGEGPCPALAGKRSRAMAAHPGQVKVILGDRVNAALGLEFIRENPIAYARLCLRRTWSVILPFHPRANQGSVHRAALLVYWLMVVPAGIVGLIHHLRRPSPQVALLAFLIAASLLPLVAVFFSPDLRYRVGVDLLLGCFAGAEYAAWFGYRRPHAHQR